MASNLDPFTRPRSITLQHCPGYTDAELRFSQRWSRIESLHEEAHLAQRWGGLGNEHNRRLSTFSSFVRRPSDRRTLQAREFESELDSNFRMSWYTDLELLDGPTLQGDKAKVIEKTEQDQNVVDWDGPHDPENPLNWSRVNKWANIITISSITLITTLASSMFAPGVSQVMEDFHSDSNLLASLVVSIFILGYVFGPLLVAPLAELFGRLYVYHASHILFTGFTVACAYSNSIGMLITFRLLAGIVGSTPITIGGGSVADMFIPLERGKAMSIWSIGPLLGPVIGPIGGGFLTAARGWRSVFCLLTIAMASATLFSALVLRESYAPTLLAAKASRLRHSAKNPHLVSKYLATEPLRRTTILTRALVRPAKMLLFSPIVLSLSCYMALTYGYLYLLFTTLTDVFESVYHFRTSLVGLTYLGIGIGLIAGMTLFGMLSDRAIAAASAREGGGALKPERRLLALIPAAACIPMGLLIYGWTAEKGVFWILPIFGTLIYGLGLIGTFMPIMVYLVDVFTVYAASATAANTVLRSLGGALLPLAGKPMYERLGLGWGNTLLACIAMAGLPISWAFLKYGERIRLRYPVEL